MSKFSLFLDHSKGIFENLTYCELTMPLACFFLIIRGCETDFEGINLRFFISGSEQVAAVIEWKTVQESQLSQSSSFLFYNSRFEN